MRLVALSTLVLIGSVGMTGAATASNRTTAPLSLPPSQYFEGDDGWWSSFEIQVGTPPQGVRLLPGTSAAAGSSTWVVLAENCWEANPDLPSCESLRGYTFTRNESSTWSDQRLANGGLYQLETLVEGYLGLTGSAYYGFDTVNLGIDGQGLPTLVNQLIAGLATDNYWLGSLGLSPIPFNFSNLDDPVPSMLGILWNESYVPGSSWAYTAGAFYQDPPVLGSLTFGGYDTTRLDPSNILSDIAFGAESDSRDLVVELRTITYNTLGSEPLLSEATSVFIDPMTSQIWLPLDVCQNFEQAFNLTRNANSSLYLIDEDVHDAILDQNPVLTFTLGAGMDSDAVDIVLPYAAFDLNITLPIVDGPSRYFPLQRAQNASQYTLGRVFLQEAYVIADYDRHNFSVSQALFPSTSVAQQSVAICAPGNEAACRRLGLVLSKGAVAGIVVGAITLVCFITVGALWMFCRHRQQIRQQAEHLGPADTINEKVAGPAEDTSIVSESRTGGTNDASHELESCIHRISELGGGSVTAAPSRRHEMQSWEPPEMAGKEAAAFELEAPLK